MVVAGHVGEVWHVRVFLFIVGRYQELTDHALSLIGGRGRGRGLALVFAQKVSVSGS